MSLAWCKLVACAKSGPRGQIGIKPRLNREKGPGNGAIFRNVSNVSHLQITCCMQGCTMENLFFSLHASRKTCHTFQKRVFLKILCLQCKLDNKSRCLCILDRSERELIKNTPRYYTPKHPIRHLYNTTASRVRIGNSIGHITWSSWPTLHGRKLTLQTNAENISTLTNIMVRQLSKEKRKLQSLRGFKIFMI